MVTLEVSKDELRMIEKALKGYAISREEAAETQQKLIEQGSEVANEERMEENLRTAEEMNELASEISRQR